MEFSLDVGPSQRAFQLQALVVRIVPGGVGVVFSNPDPHALRMLQRLSTPAPYSKDSQSSALRDGLGSAGDRAAQTVVAMSRDVVSEHLRKLLKSFFEQIKGQLVEAARDAKSNVEQTYYFEAITELEKLQGLIEKAFAGSILEGLEHLGQPRALQSVPSENEPDAELSLVDQDEFEDLLAVNEIIAKAEPRYQQPLSEVEQRLTSGAKTPIERGSNPIGPAAVCHAFRNALQGSNIQRVAMHVVYDVFEQSVVSCLGRLYDDLNSVLQENGVLPTLPGHSTRHPSPSHRAPTSGSPATEQIQHADDPAPTQVNPMSSPASDGERDDTPAFAGSGGVARPPARELSHAGTAAQDWLGAGMHGQAPVARRQTQSMPSTPQPVPRAATAPHATGASALGAARALFHIARQVNVPGTSEQASAPVPGDSPSPQPGATDTRMSSHAELLSALDRLQREPRYAQDGLGTRTSLKSRLLGLLNDSNESGTATRIEAPYDDHLDVVAHLFQAMLEDPELPEHAKGWIRRLEAPLYKLGLLDPGFLNDTTHPARQVLDQLGRINPELGTQKEPAKKEVIERAVQHGLDRIIESFDRDIGVFSDVGKTLDELLSRQREAYADNVADVVKRWRQQQAFVQARRRTLDPRDRAPGVAATKKTVSDEWRAWLNRAKNLKPGDGLVITAGSGRAQHLNLVWVGEDYHPFVFVDTNGHKALTLSLQELAMHLRRRTAIVSKDQGLPLLERALYSTLQTVHHQIEYQATHDSATKVLNRKAFEWHLEQALRSTGQANGPTEAALYYIDLVQFEAMQSAHGREVADAYLKQLCDLLQREGGHEPILGRLEDSALGVLCQRDRSQSLVELAAHLQGIIERCRFQWGLQVLASDARLGGVRVAPDMGPAARLVDTARLSACRDVDARSPFPPNRDRAPDLQPTSDQKANWTALLEAVFADDRLQLQWQRIAPVVEGGAERPYCELLIAPWEGDQGKFSGEWLVQVAESCGRSVALDRLVIQKALKWMAEHKQILRRMAGCAIKLSDSALADEGFLDFLVEQLSVSKVPPGRICFEVTEASALSSVATGSSFMRTMKELGCRFALHRFGSGQSPYGALKGLPFDYVKIDGRFVRDIERSASDLAVVKSLNEIGHLMDKKTIAEAVETRQTLEQLREIGVDFAQGPGIEAPCGLEQTEQLC